MRIILTLGVVLALTGCMSFPEFKIPETEAQLYPVSDGTYEAIALSYSEADAARATLKRAERTCLMAEQRLVVLENHVQYHGVSKELGAVTSMLDKAVFRNTDSMGTGSTKSGEDYKATLKFRCE